MNAVVITRYGPPEVLEVQHVPVPAAAGSEVLIQVAATALNRADLLQRQGRYDPPGESPPYPGLEVAGHILAAGEQASRFRVGDRVMALLPGGGYAEQVAVAEGSVMPAPTNLTLREAAAIPEAWLTAYSNLIEIAGLQPGESVLIHAGASGVGSAAIQLAKWRGATVFSTASAGKLDSLRALGADQVIDYRAQNFANEVLDITSGRGVDVVMDFIGAPYWGDNLRALALWGRLVLVGLMGGRETRVNLGTLMAKKLSVHASTLRDRTIVQKSALVSAFTQSVLPDFERGSLRPVLDPATFRLDQVVEAHRYMESNRNVGKIVITVAGG